MMSNCGLPLPLSPKWCVSMFIITRVSLVILTLSFGLPAAKVWAQPPTAKLLTAEQRQELDAGLAQLDQALIALKSRADLPIADAAIFAKGVNWAMSYDSEFSAADFNLMQKAIARGLERAKSLATAEIPWKARLGKQTLGYVSQVDQSVQPYGLIVPWGYDKSQPIRLDVVLHGSTRPVGLSELRFMSRFDEGDAAATAAPSQTFIELHPLGRVENCYRWAGETDVFEAIEDVCRRFNIDRDRIVLRGMSMGASGTWHLGLKHPDRFVAIGPYCGYVDTHRFSETAVPNFVKVGPLPEHQELGLHMLDSVDYAANASVVPAIACMGEKDIFFDAHVIMGQAFQREGLPFVNLISPGTGHVIDPVTHAEQMRRISEYVNRGLNRRPKEIRFVTWTLKYSDCHWLQVLALGQHYARAEFNGKLVEDQLTVDEPRNITRFAIRTDRLPSFPKSIRIGSVELKCPDTGAASGSKLVFSKLNGAWQQETEVDGKANPVGKRPGLQGPIDDAFATPFLCVRGTGKPWNSIVQAYSDASLKRFAGEWRHYFRGDLPIKDDTAVTEEDLQTKNLILFGDPGSNSWIAKTLPQLPAKWTRESVHLGGKDYLAASHILALIAPNPLCKSANRYVVINSGHTFREADLAKFNYLLFPRWGDWAVLHVEPQPGSEQSQLENVVEAGYFNESWKLD